MQYLRNSILAYMRIEAPLRTFVPQSLNGRCRLDQVMRICSTPTKVNHDEVVGRVVDLVKKYDKINANKVTETADFQKDLSLDSLDRVDLVMAFEEEFSVEIPDAEADKLKCCADVAKYIVSSTSEKVSENS